MTDTELIAQAVSTAHRVNALQLGSPEAIADAQQRRETAIRQAHQTLDEMDAFDKKQQEIADRLVNGAPEDGLDIEYDTNSEGDEC